MKRCNWLGVALATWQLVCGHAAMNAAGAEASPFEAKEPWQVHVELSPEAFAAMQPVGGEGFPGFGGPGRPAPAERPAAAGDVHRNQFGVDLPWGAGKVTIGEQAFPNVGIRYKGNGTIMDASRTIKKSIKVKLDRGGETDKFLGLNTINLHCGVTDPSKCRETLAYSLYREAGVPAPRTALAEVRLTVPEKYDEELLGLYTMVEQVGSAFLRANFGDDQGLLMKPEGVRDLEYLGDEWGPYEAKLAPERKATDQEAERIIALARLIHQADDVAFTREIADYIDVDNYLRFLAATAYISNSDSFFSLGHNYYLYLHPGTGQFHFIPWDLDRAFANFFIFGSHAQQMDLSLQHPYAGSHRLTERLLKIPDVKDRYQKLLKELAAGCFDQKRLLRELASLDETAEELVAREKESAARRQEGAERGFGPPGMSAEPPTLETFIAKRTESVAAQLADASAGYVPTGGFGPGGFGGFGPPGGGGRRPSIGEMMAGPLLGGLDADEDRLLARAELVQAIEDLFDDCQLDDEECANEEAIAAALDGRFPKPPAGGPPGPPFSLGRMMAGPIVKRADSDGNGMVASAELTTAAAELFDEFDAEKSGKLDQAAFAKLLTELFPAGEMGPRRGGPERGR